jgi:hypothetical protein
LYCEPNRAAINRQKCFKTFDACGAEMVHNSELYFDRTARGALPAGGGVAAPVGISIDSATGLGELAVATGCGGIARQGEDWP